MSLVNFEEEIFLQELRHFALLFHQVGDNQCLLQSLKDSPYYKGFEDKASLWETRLADLDEYLHNLNQIQRKWVYLEPIFGRGALPREQGRFKRVDDDFRFVSFLWNVGMIVVFLVHVRCREAAWPSSLGCCESLVTL